MSFDPGQQNLGKSGAHGICVYVCDSIPTAQVSIVNPLATEHLWLQIKLRGADNLLIGCVYKSPSVDPHQSVDKLVQLLQEVHRVHPSHLLICGDFNLPQIDWSASFCPASESHYSHIFLAAVHDSLLFQHVTQITRYREGGIPSLLDLVLTNEEGMLSRLEYSPGLGKSDHVLLTFELPCYTTQSVNNLRRLNFNRADFPELNKKVAETDWDTLLSLSVDEGYELFKVTLDRIVTSCIPDAQSRQSRRSIYLTSNALQLRKLKTFCGRSA